MMGDRVALLRSATRVAAFAALTLVPAAAGASPQAPDTSAALAPATVLAPAFQGMPVVAISIVAPAILRGPAREAVSVRIGTPYVVDDIRRSLQNIYSLGNVSDVRVTGEAAGDGLRLEFLVLPAADVHRIRIEGDIPIRRGILEDALTANVGDRVTRALLEAQAVAVQQALSDRGYAQATVEPELLLDSDGIEATLVLHTEAGTPTRLKELQIVGNLGISLEEARAAFGMTESAVFRQVNLIEGLETLRRRLAEDRFFYADVGIDSQASNPDANTADLRILVDAGPRVELDFRGWNRSEEELYEMLPFFEEVSVADWILNQTRADIIAELQAQGYWKPLVTYGRERDAEGRNVAIVFTIMPATKVDLKVVEIEGNTRLSDASIRAVIGTHEPRLLRGATFTSAQWRRDQRSIISLYRRGGFLEARIDEAPVARDVDAGGLRATLRIHEDVRTTVDLVTIDTRGDLSSYGVDTGAWSGALQLRPGGPFSPDALRQDETRLRILLANAGFPRAMVVSEVTDVEEHRRNVSFSVFPGQRVRVGQVLISGNQRVKDDVIRRELSLVPGSPFTQEDIIRSQSRLYQLGLFSRVEIDTARPNSTETQPAVIVKVEEGSTQRLSWGLGYSTEEQVRGLVVVGEDNLWRRNHRATGSIRASFVEQRVRFIYTNPYLLGRRLEGSAVGYYESIDQKGFKVQGFGTSLQFVKRHSNVLTSIGRYSFRDQQTFDVQIDPDELEPEDRDAVIGSVIYTLLSDSRPNPIDPSSGAYHTVDVEFAGRALGSEADYLKLFGRSYWYWGLPNDSVFVAAARVGYANPSSNSSVPLPERFFAGGSTTLRGFGRNEAGPQDKNGNPLGGNVLLIGNLEYRFPVRGNVGAVVFLDVGNVFADLRAISRREIRETLGAGIRYSTPIGPLRFDWGYLLDRRTGEDGSRLHFAIGQAF